MADLQYPPADTDQSSYIDYDTFLAPDFDPAAFANSLVLATNDPNDPTSSALDLATPLSRVLFDIQEIDAHIDLLTARSAVPLLTYTRDQNAASTRLVADLQPQIDGLNASYRQLERQVLQRHAEADQVLQTALRLWEAMRLGRAISRSLQLGRQLVAQYAELLGDNANTAGKGSAATTGASLPSGDHHAFVRCAHTILSLRQLLQHQTAPGEEGHGLDQVDVVKAMQTNMVAPTEIALREAADRVVRAFAPGSASLADSLGSRAEETKARTTSALLTLYLLSPTPAPTRAATSTAPWSPTLLIQSIETYLRANLQTSLSAVSRALGTLPTLDRTLGDVSVRCQNIVALETLLAAIKTPAHPLDAAPVGTGATLQRVVLAKLETSSLGSYFWRSLASGLSPRVQELMIRGGVAARTLRTNKTSVGDAIQACVVRGMTGGAAASSKDKTAKENQTPAAKAADARTWEREIAVMVGSVTGHLGR